MLKPTVKRGLMLDFIPDEIFFAAETDSRRVFKLNEKEILPGDIIYVMSRELRIEDNWALIFASNLSKKRQKKLKIIINLSDNYNSKHQESFLLAGLKLLEKNLEINAINYEISEKIPQQAGALIFDFNPIVKLDEIVNNISCAAFEVDSHNIIPARFISDKQEFSAATLRRKVYANLADYLTKFPNNYNIIKGEAYRKLDDFVNNKLNFYTELKNNPNMDMTSKLSPYFHFGFISSQRVALEVIKSAASRENKEAFLEELIVRKELADNFCLYGKSYNTLDGILDWAKETLGNHREDIHTYIYDLKAFEYAKTHDELWNAIQQSLLMTGKIHGYLRMYWAKKILEWSRTPEEALNTAIYLNDEYALDGLDPNGYVGILWSIGGLHDRPFTNRMVTGKIRYMSMEGCKKKFDVDEYIKRNKG